MQPFSKWLYIVFVKCNILKEKAFFRLFTLASTLKVLGIYLESIVKNICKLCYMHFTVKSICKILYFVQSVSPYMVSKIISYVICDNFSYLGILRMFGYMMGYIVVDICICRILQHKLRYSCVL